MEMLERNIPWHVEGMPQKINNMITNMSKQNQISGLIWERIRWGWTMGKTVCKKN